MNEPPPDEQRIEARPGSEIPRWSPPANDEDEQDQQHDWYERWHQGLSADSPSLADDEEDYRGPSVGETHDEAVAPEPLNPPADSPYQDQRGRPNGRAVIAPPAGQGYQGYQDAPANAYAQDWSDYGQDQAAASGYEPDAESASGVTGLKPMKIALWGSPASGKTTFLAVLRHATSGLGGHRPVGRGGIGNWNVYPMDQASTMLMANFTHQLSQGYFPNPTDPGEQVPLQWMFVGDIANSRFVRKRNRLLHRGGYEQRFVLDLVDMSGKAFGHDPATEDVPKSVAEQALNRLTTANGIIYLFDPIGERDNRNSSSYVNRAITELKYRAVSGRHAPHFLGQQVAICITKFDDPSVFQEARRHGYVNHDEYGMPHVLDKHAEEFFDLLCTDRYWRTRFEQSSQSADFIRRELRQVFGTENIKYYVTSSIGFYRPPGWRPDGSPFDPEDFSNVVQVAGNRPRIRGTINPINVLEPLVDVYQRISPRVQPG